MYEKDQTIIPRRKTCSIKIEAKAELTTCWLVSKIITNTAVVNDITCNLYTTQVSISHAKRNELHILSYIQNSINSIYRSQNISRIHTNIDEYLFSNVIL